MRIEEKLIIFEGIEDIKELGKYVDVNLNPVMGEFIVSPDKFIDKPIYGLSNTSIGSIPIHILALNINKEIVVLIHPDIGKMLDWIRDNNKFGNVIALDIARQLETVLSELPVKGKEVAMEQFKAPTPTKDCHDVEYHYDRDALQYLKRWVRGDKEGWMSVVRHLCKSQTGAVLAKDKGKDAPDTEYIVMFKIGGSIEDMALLRVILIRGWQPIAIMNAVKSSEDLDKVTKSEFGRAFRHYL